MKELDVKLNKHFEGKVVRKDLTKLVKGNAIVPTYVLEYLLGQYCATDDEETINQGVETVKNINLGCIVWWQPIIWFCFSNTLK